MKKKIKINTLSVIISLICVIVLIGLDQLTKYIASHNETLLSGEKIIFIKYLLSFELAFNKGAAWSILSGKKFLLVSISVIASLACLSFLVLTSDFKKKKLYSISLILITSGAMGNLIDRAFFKDGVIDFLNFEFMTFPIFNGADSFLTIGAVLLAIYLLFIYKDDKKDKDASEENKEEVETSNDEVNTKEEIESENHNDQNNS